MYVNNIFYHGVNVVWNLVDAQRLEKHEIEETMKNQDVEVAQNVHLYIALRRKKENPELQALCFREIIHDELVDLERLKLRLGKHEGIWRIHKTVNARDTKKALKLFQHKIIENENINTRFESEWKTCLLNSGCKVERNILLDIDSEEAYSQVYEVLHDNNIEWIEHIKTPNGYHITLDLFDTRLVENIKDVTILRDGYIFVEIYGKLPRNENLF